MQGARDRAIRRNTNHHLSAYSVMMDTAIEAMDLLGAGDIFSVRERSSRELWRQIEKGLPVASAKKVLQRIPSANRPQWESLIQGTDSAMLSTENSERTGRLAYVLALTKEVWGTWPAASLFLTTPNGDLDGKTPLEAVHSEAGSREVEAVLRKIQFGLPA